MTITAPAGAAPPASAELIPAGGSGIARWGAPVIGRGTIALAQAGDHAAFEAIFSAYQTPIYNYIYRIMHDPDDAYEMTQDTFLKAYLRLGSTSDDLNLTGWLYRIATNRCRDELRHRKLVKWQPWEAFISVFHPSQIAKDDHGPIVSALEGEVREAMAEVLGTLPPKYRMCLVLREYQQLSYDEIAGVLNTTRAGVKSLLFRARELVRQWIVGHPTSPLFLAVGGD